MNRIRDKKRWFAANFCTTHVAAPDNSFELLMPLGLALAFLMGFAALVGLYAIEQHAPGAGVGFAIVLSSRPKLLGTLNFSSGGGDKLTSGNGLTLNRFKGFLLVFTATFNKSGAANFGTIASEVPFNLFRDVRVYGKSLLQKGALRFHRQLNHKYLRKTDATFQAPTATNTNQTIGFSAYIDAVSLRTNFPDGSILDLSKNVTSPSFEVDFGTVEDLIAGGDYTTKTITGATVQVYGIIDEQTIFKNFQFSDRELKYIEKTVTGTQTEYPIDLPLGRSVLRMLVGQWTPGPEVLITTAIPSSAKLRVDVNGKPVWGPFTAQEIQRWNIADTEGIGLDTGYLVIDFLRHSFQLKDWMDLTNSVNISDPSRVTGAQLIVDVTNVANAKIGVLVDGLVPPFLQKAA